MCRTLRNHPRRYGVEDDEFMFFCTVATMGSWGPGLYSDDYALDVKPMVGPLCKLPLSGAEIVNILVGLEPAASQPDDEDHSVFWLVVADQLQRRGIESPARPRALKIIDSGRDLQIRSELGLDDRGIAKRRQGLATLRNFLAAPPVAKARRTIKKPQPLLYAPGDVITAPVDRRGNCRNPYDSTDILKFQPTGWGGVQIVSCGHEFEYLAWYYYAETARILRERPNIDEVVANLAEPEPTCSIGTLSRSRQKRMGFELLGNAPVAEYKPPRRRNLIAEVVADSPVSLELWL